VVLREAGLELACEEAEAEDDAGREDEVEGATKKIRDVRP
jgi:hypothetical protein